jgi:diguanylate cyclase
VTFRFSSLRSALLLPFVGLIVATACAIGGLSYLTGVRAVEDFSEQMLSDTTYRVSQAIVQHLNVPKTAINTVAPDANTVLPGATAAISELAPLGMPDIERRLWLSTALFKDVSGYVYYGTADGRFIGVNRSAGGTEVRAKDRADVQRVAYRSSGPGIRGDEIRRDDFDPRVRPWYKSAIAANGMAWSPIYVSTTSKALTLTLAKPVFDASNQLHGVIATDMPLQELDDFLGTIRTSKSGVAFIVDSKGELIATSSAQKLVADEGGKQVRIKASGSSNTLIRESFASYSANQQNGGAVNSQGRLWFDSQIGIVDLAATPHTDVGGLNWTVLVAVPRADHMGNLRNTVFQNIVIGLLAIAMAVSFGLWFTQRIARDVTRLSEATRLLASGQAPALDLKRNDEIGSIAQSMAKMSSGLLTDPLTGTLNRATLEKRFEAMFGQVASTDAVGGALVFIDMNGFKQINDTHGHTVGDALLAVTAQRLASTLRRTDAIARFGGDEFVLLLAANGQHEVDATINRCREQMKSPVVVAGHKLSVNAAFGSALIPSDGTTLAQLIAAADKKMYEEKTTTGSRRSQRA